MLTRLMPSSRRISLILVFCWALSGACAQGHPADWATASDVARDVLVAAALGVPAAKGDWRGDVQAGESLLAAGGTTLALKELVPELRPDRSDRRSFPSGHTSMAFASAATLANRYGWQAGLPAFAVAASVGVGRVRSDKHYIHDVLAGAAIGTASGMLLTKRQNQNVRYTAWADGHSAGLNLALRF